MRIVFMGTPDFAACSLNKLYEGNFDVVGVFTQPDKPKGRGLEMTQSPVKQLAVEHGTPVFQPEKLRDGTALEIVRSLNPDVLVVVAYGRLLPDEILDVPKYGAINVHASLLPKYRGAAPIQWAVLNGDKYTGVTTMYLSSEMDAGDIIYSETAEIGEFETSGELFEKLKVLGADLLIKTLESIQKENAPRIHQEHELSSYARQLDKSMCPIDFSKTAREVVKWIYGLQPWPVATMNLNGVNVRVFSASYTNNQTVEKPGKIISAGNSGIEIACAGGGTVLITEIQIPGKKRMSVADYLRGHPIKDGN